MVHPSLTRSLGWPTISLTIHLKGLLLLLVTLACTVGVWFGLDGLSAQTRITLVTFGLAIAGWTLTEIEDAYIALIAVAVLAVTHSGAQEQLLRALGDPIIWLMLASFIIAGAVTAAGLSHRLALAVSVGSGTVQQLFYRLTAVIFVSALIIPATSGRAALMLPVFVALARTLPTRRMVTALALLFPTIILLSAFASLIGAGAHLVMVDILWRMSGERIGYGEWLLLGLPFALVSCYLSTWVILHLFLNRAERQQPLSLAQPAAAGRGALSRKEWFVLAVVVGLVTLWATESLHGIDNVTVAILGSLLVTAPCIGVISFKQGMKEVNWSLLLFMAGTMILSEGLLATEGVRQVLTTLFTDWGAALTSHPLWLVGLVAGVALLSHLVITSRTARVSVLAPLVVLTALALGYQPLLLALVVTAGTGFCQTLPVSAKPVAMFSQVDGETYRPADLLRLSLALLPIHLLLLVGFAFWVWPQLGFGLNPLSAAPAKSAIVVIPLEQPDVDHTEVNVRRHPGELPFGEEPRTIAPALGTDADTVGSIPAVRPSPVATLPLAPTPLPTPISPVLPEHPMLAKLDELNGLNGEVRLFLPLIAQNSK